MAAQRNDIEELESAFEEGDLDRVRQMLPSLLKRKSPEAIRIAASFSDAGESAEAFDRRYVAGMFEAASLGDIKAQYSVGVFYDLGEYGIERDLERAAKIFESLSLREHPHSMWIHAINLTYGCPGISVDEKRGIGLLVAAAGSGSAEACITLAKFHHDGAHGFEKSIKERDRYRALALEYDDTTFDPYA